MSDPNPYEGEAYEGETDEEPTIRQLIYASAATRELSDEELAEILDKARRKNAALDVTGMLLYHEGSFLQVLEGEAAAVEALYARISEDNRHTRTLIILKTDAKERAFRDWRMAFCRTSEEDLEALPGLSDCLTHGRISSMRPGAQGEAARRVLGAFREGQWRRRLES